MTASDAELAPAPKGGLIEDFVDVFVHPTSLFNRVRNSSFVRPALIQTVIFLVLVLAVRNLVSPFMEAEIERSMGVAAASGQPVPENAQAMGSTIARFSSMVGPVIAPWFMAIFGGLATLIGARIAGAKLSFGQSAMVASWSAMPSILGYMALAIQGAVLDTSSLRGVSDGSIGPTRFLNPDTTPPVVISLLNQLDLFSIWGLVITAIGVSVVAKVDRSAGALAAVIKFALFALLTLIPALMR